MNYKIFKTDLKPWLKKFFFEKFSYIVKAITGTIITITDGIRKKVNEFRMTKESSQKTTTGKNLFNKDLLLNKNFNTVTGEITDDNSKLLINEEFINLENGTYTLSMEYVNQVWILYYDNNGIYHQGQVAWNTSSPYTFTVSGYNKIRFGFNRTINEVRQEITKNNVIIQVEHGTLATSYEAYTGGIPSPNPDYPQEVNTVKGYRNLYNPNQTYTIGQYVSGVWFSDTARVTSDYIEVSTGEQLTIYCDLNNDNKVSLINYNFFDSSYTWLGSRVENGDTSFNGEKTKTFTINLSDVKYVRITFRNVENASSIITIEDVQNSQIQLTRSASALPYVPYGTNWIYTKVSNGTNTNYYTIPLNDNEIVGIGNYKDELIIDRNGHCYLNKKTGKKVYNGTESGWQKSSNTNVDRYAINTSLYTANTGSKCNYFRYGSYYNYNVGYFVNNSSVQLLFNYATAGTTTLDDWKTWLSTHNLIIYQPLATEQLIDLNYTVDMRFFNGINNITNSEDMDMAIKYYSK